MLCISSARTQVLAPAHVHLYLIILSTLGSLDKLPTYCTSSPLLQAPFGWQVCRSSLTSIPPQADAKNGPSCQLEVNHRCPISILAMSTTCTARNHPVLVLNSLLTKQRSLFCSPESKHISNCMYLLTD